MIASQHRKIALGVGKCTLLDVFHPSAVDPERHLVLFLARHTAGVTSDTFAVVNQKAKFHDHSCL
jgi:hypothetical protein